MVIKDMISTFGWICICFGLLIIKYGFLQALEDKRMYRLYEARDNVALAAVEGKISQDAEEYKFVIKNINCVLYYMQNNFDFSIFVKNLVVQPEDVEEYVNNMIDLVQGYDFLEKNYNISTAYFKKSINIRLFIFIHLAITPFSYGLRFLLLLLKLGEKMTDFSVKLMEGTEKRINIIGEINNAYGNYRKSYAK